jgi:hypothetical protein
MPEARAHKLNQSKQVKKTKKATCKRVSFLIYLPHVLIKMVSILLECLSLIGTEAQNHIVMGFRDRKWI